MGDSLCPLISNLESPIQNYYFSASIISADFSRNAYVEKVFFSLMNSQGSKGRNKLRVIKGEAMLQFK